MTVLTLPAHYSVSTERSISVELASRWTKERLVHSLLVRNDCRV